MASRTTGVSASLRIPIPVLTRRPKKGELAASWPFRDLSLSGCGALAGAGALARGCITRKPATALKPVVPRGYFSAQLAGSKVFNKVLARSWAVRRRAALDISAF